MPMSQRVRARLVPVDLRKYFTRDPQFDHVAHSRDHIVKRLSWTSNTTLDTTAGSKIPVTHPMRIIRVSLKVSGTAPGSTLTGDVLLNGTSIYAVGGNKPTVAASATASAVPGYPDYAFCNDGDYLQCQLTATGSAGGPIIFLIEYVDEGA